MKPFLLFWLMCGACSVSTMSLADNFCDRPPGVGGICRMPLPFFTYDKSKNECISFLYGGCGGNENRFLTIEACTQTCMQTIL
ncbi:kunitz-type serine protease inhibitor-like [Drosophila guanche]|uniref:kunitz-type serine protease inhibitor-like n=1 Tax=Drosophila guanche TaxID=7266 RepID=UPI001471C244|nr:kunitz-type serine protease inhibitor-like [Drosophila guanche]